MILGTRFGIIVILFIFSHVMPKQQLKAWLPKPEELRKNKVIAVFAPFLADARLWHLNRNSLIRAIFVGVMCAFFPLPGQMPLALMGALAFRANIPMSIALTWLTNPLTGLPVYWFAYLVGATLLGEPAIGLRTVGVVLTDTTVWLFHNGANPFIGQQIFSLKVFALGLVVTGLLTSLILSLAFSLFWRYRIAKDWKKRQGYQSHIPKFSLQEKHNSHKNSPKNKG